MSKTMRNLLKNREGVTVIEFALTAPILLMMIFFAYSYTWYVNVRQSIEGAAGDAVNAFSLRSSSDYRKSVKELMISKIEPLALDADVDVDVSNYFSFTDEPTDEPYTDRNSDGKCNKNEQYLDLNGDEEFGQLSGTTGQGGNALDYVQVVVTVTYDDPFPALNGFWANTGGTNAETDKQGDHRAKWVKKYMTRNEAFMGAADTDKEKKSASMRTCK